MPELSRRRALTAAAALAATAGVQTAARAATPATADAGPATHATHNASSPGSPGSPAAFDEVYKGRRIQGRPTAGGGHHGGGHHGDGHNGGHHDAGYAVFVDGVELHVMSNADGSWISVVSHYDPVATPRAAARAAVDELRGAPLLPFPTN
ncbi:tyrosinase cofactor [Streptomyces sp. NPDC006172]|uniref:apotyrosinase chaperone MelC1 n=1 Tax=Streptomyces sp. NPDC006172 TaxID=3154470 RepID=UPI0033ED4E67